MASKFRSWQYSSCLRYSQDIQKGNTCDGISRIFPAVQCPCDQDVGLLGKFCWSHQICPLCVCTVWYGMTTILLGPDFWCHFNGALRFVLKVLRGNVLWHLAISVPSMPSICMSHTIIPLMSHMTSIGFSISFQWCTLYCVKCTVWEILMYLLPSFIYFRSVGWWHAPISW